MRELKVKHETHQAEIDLALAVATKAHEGQKRKYTGEPYIVHPMEVAEIVAVVTNDYHMISAALLHDVMEDCGETEQSLWDKGIPLGTIELVQWLTDVSKPEDGNRKFRKEMDRKHTAESPPAAKTVKLADLISNSRCILQNDPNFAVVYMREKSKLMAVLMEGDEQLFAIAAQIVNDYYSGMRKHGTEPAKTE